MSEGHELEILPESSLSLSNAVPREDLFQRFQVKGYVNPAATVVIWWYIFLCVFLAALCTFVLNDSGQCDTRSDGTTTLVMWILAQKPQFAIWEKHLTPVGHL